MVALPELRSQTASAIEQAWADAQELRHDRVLRCSSLGQECARRLWYGFRWAHAPERHNGRLLRLFETGNIEEDRLVADLRRIGCDVLPVDPETGEQFEVSFIGGHMTGHTDGQVEGVPEAPKVAHLLECKSHNEKSFNALVKNGVQASKPVHYAQMQIYMHGRGLSRALYIAVNKNDDDIYSERVQYDPVFGLQLVAKGEQIVRAHTAPLKLHEDPLAKMAWACGSCPAHGVCHDGDLALRNCRTCLFVTPEMDGDGRWSCQRHQRDLTLDDQRAGCPNHLYLPSLIAGEQIDVADDGEWVAYQLADGSTWTDGVRA